MERAEGPAFHPPNTNRHNFTLYRNECEWRHTCGGAKSEHSFCSLVLTFANSDNLLSVTPLLVSHEALFGGSINDLLDFSGDIRQV